MDKRKQRDSAKHMEQYNQRKADGLCVDCGKAPPEEGKVRCRACLDVRISRNHSDQRRAYQRQYQNDLRQWRTQHHLCRDCGKEDARTLVGHTVCFDCLEKRNACRTDYQKTEAGQQSMQRRIEQAKQDRIDREAQGLCTTCGKRPADHGFKSCGVCRGKSRQRKRKQYEQRRAGQDGPHGIPRSEWPAYGFCYICGSPLGEIELAWNTDKKKSHLCPACYARSVKVLDAYRKSERGLRELWPMSSGSELAIQTMERLKERRRQMLAERQTTTM